MGVYIYIWYISNNLCLEWAEVTKWVATNGSHEGISTNWHGSIQQNEKKKTMLPKHETAGIWFALRFAT